jgi:hypothetical protein
LSRKHAIIKHSETKTFERAKFAAVESLTPRNLLVGKLKSRNDEILTPPENTPHQILVAHSPKTQKAIPFSFTAQWKH